MARALNKKQLRFVAEFLKSGNGTEAYMQAGFTCTRDSARAAAPRLLADPRVKELLQPSRDAADLERAEMVQGITINRDRIRLELARLSFVDPRRLFDDSGKLKPVRELDPDTAAALAQFEVHERDDDGVTVRVTKVKLWDKNRALQNLADTEPGVWSEDAKDRAGDMHVHANIENRILSLTAADVAAVDKLLGLNSAFEGAADRETPPPAIEERKP